MDHRSETRPSFAGALLDLELVEERNRRDECLNFMKAIAAATENSQRKVDLRGSKDLHNLQFALSFQASRGMERVGRATWTVAPRG